MFYGINWIIILYLSIMYILIWQVDFNQVSKTENLNFRKKKNFP